MKVSNAIEKYAEMKRSLGFSNHWDAGTLLQPAIISSREILFA
jgi:hypothetical protein